MTKFVEIGRRNKSGTHCCDDDDIAAVAAGGGDSGHFNAFVHVHSCRNSIMKSCCVVAYVVFVKFNNITPFLDNHHKLEHSNQG